MSVERVAPEFGPLPPNVASPFPTTVLWRWRYELAAVVLLGAGGWVAVSTLGAAASAAACAGIALVVVMTGPIRRRVRRRLCWLVTPHRVRLGLAQAWVHNRRGRLPVLLRTRMTDEGEAVLLWCPAGVSVEHVAASADVLCSACWAREVRVSVDPRRGQLVTVHVVRRRGTRGW